MGHVAAVAAFRDDRSSCRAGRPVPLDAPKSPPPHSAPPTRRRSPVSPLQAPALPLVRPPWATGGCRMSHRRPCQRRRRAARWWRHVAAAAPPPPWPPMHRRGGVRTGMHAAAAQQTAQTRRAEVTEPRGEPQRRPALGICASLDHRFLMFWSFFFVPDHGQTLPISHPQEGPQVGRRGGSGASDGPW